tara:strand:- start:20563 stop:21606 length:1044 start_codon:yes stop_codon:yes gene_type:complete
MAEYKVACPQCGQYVSGDETFLGITVQCPICSTQFQFPENLAPSEPVSPPAGPPAAAAGGVAAAGPATDPGQYFNVPTPSGHAPSTVVERSSSLATWSLILGILGLLSVGCTFGVPSLLAVIFGIVALVKISGSGGILVGKVKAIIGTVLGLASLAMGVSFLLIAINAEPIVETAFDKAESKISSSSDGEIGFGNTEEAGAIATTFATRMKAIRELAIDGKDSTVSLSGNQFLTFCQLNEDSAAFLVHVPGLRNYTEEAKEFIAEAAWSVAQDLLMETSLPDGSQLGVGTKGFLLYDRILVGSHLKSYHEDDSEKTGIKLENGEEEDLEWFFPQPEPEEGAESSSLE